MLGRARGRKGERKTYHINPYHHIPMEFGGYLLNVAKNPTRARARKGEAQGVLSYQKATGIFDNPHMLKLSCPFFDIQIFFVWFMLTKSVLVDWITVLIKHMLVCSVGTTKPQQWSRKNTV